MTFTWEEKRLRGKKNCLSFVAFYIVVWSLSFPDCALFVWRCDKTWITAVTASVLGVKLPLESSVCVRENAGRVASTLFWEGRYSSVWKTVKSRNIFERLHFFFSFQRYKDIKYLSNQGKPDQVGRLWVGEEAELWVLYGWDCEYLPSLCANRGVFFSFISAWLAEDQGCCTFLLLVFCGFSFPLPSISLRVTSVTLAYLLVCCILQLSLLSGYLLEVCLSPKQQQTKDKCHCGHGIVPEPV